MALAAPARIAARSVTVSIGRLSVEGWTAPAARRLGHGLERALTELIRARGLPAAWRQGAVPAPALDLPEAAWRDPETLAQALAEALYGPAESGRAERRDG